MSFSESPVRLSVSHSVSRLPAVGFGGRQLPITRCLPCQAHNRLASHEKRDRCGVCGYHRACAWLRCRALVRGDQALHPLQLPMRHCNT